MSESRMSQWLSRFYGHFTETIRRPFLIWPASTPLLFIFFPLLVGLFLVTRLLDSTQIILTTTTTITDTNHITGLNCTTLNTTIACPTNNYPNSNREDLSRPTPAACPEYFRWIHEDLRPWAHTGITREMVDSGRATADFRLVIVDGKAYIETYRKAFQTRDVFTHWGILQLLRKYPGQVPDLDLMFECGDRPNIAANYYNGPHAPAPLPIFRYSSDDDSVYIVFPDWSFWGWPEINIKPWHTLLEDLKEGNKRTRWMDREPHAYWKGNPNSKPRQDVMKCNITEQQDWNVRVYAMDWPKETHEGYKNSDMASQCSHRFKIYIEGIGWSVSEKYILACDSLTLLVKPRYYDFFSRGLVPMHHYWPIKQDDKCKSLKFAVDWGNRNEQKAQAMGKAGSEFILRDLKMDYVYDYMLHLLTDYAKLLTFKPTIPENVTAMCSEKMGCPADGLVKKFMMESMVKGPADTGPCTIPPPFAVSSLYDILSRKANSTKEVELWEKKYWDSQNL